VHLTCHLNGRPVWSPEIAAFVPAPGAVPGLIPAGSAAGLFSTARCLADGAAAARRALAEIAIAAPEMPVPEAEDGRYEIQPLWAVPGKGRAWLDFANDVTVKDVTQSAQENYRSVEHMKRYTTQGMAPDQGKIPTWQHLRCWRMPRGGAFPKPAPPPSARRSARCRLPRWAQAVGRRALRRNAS
jgi:sarcosine oxidase subunit alpha